MTFHTSFTAFAAGDAVDFPPWPSAASDDDEGDEYGYHSEGSVMELGLYA